jgi:hypothetical protein
MRRCLLMISLMALVYGKAMASSVVQPVYVVNCSTSATQLLGSPAQNVQMTNVCSSGTIGNAITGGGANRMLYEDASQNLATSPNVTTNGSTVTATAFSGSGSALTSLKPANISNGALPGGVTITTTNVSATGTPSATTFFRGDNSWSAAGGGGVQAGDSTTFTGQNTFNQDVTALGYSFTGNTGSTITATTNNLQLGAGGTNPMPELPTFWNDATHGSELTLPQQTVLGGPPSIGGNIAFGGWRSGFSFNSSSISGIIGNNTTYEFANTALKIDVGNGSTTVPDLCEGGASGCHTGLGWAGASSRDLSLISRDVESARFTDTLILHNAHTEWTGTVSTITACGTGPTFVGNDSRGVITTGGGAPTSCKLTFTSAWTNAPVCEAITSSGTSLTFISAVTVNDVTFGLSVALSSGKIYYHCDGWH